MARDLDRAIAGLKRHRAWAERTRRTVAGDAELTEAAERTIRNAERIFRRIIKRAADDESGGKWH